MKQKSREWTPLSQHEEWAVEYCLEDRLVRLRLGDATMQLDREAYLLLWATLTEGLDAMELADDESNRLAGLMLDAAPMPGWSQTRH